jgi:hypothetical protein
MVGGATDMHARVGGTVTDHAPAFSFAGSCSRSARGSGASRTFHCE